MLDRVAAHDALVLCLDYDSTTAQVVSVTDTSGDTFAQALGPFTFGARRMYLFYALDTIGSAANETLTVAFDAPVPGVELYAHEYANVALSGAVDQTAANMGTSSTTDGMTSPKVITRYPNELVFGFGISGKAAPGTGLTLRLGYHDNVTEDMQAAVPGSYAAVATMTSGNAWAMTVTTLRPR
jgi:hypothetical protein